MKLKILILITFFAASNTFAQIGQLASANKKYDDLAYENAIGIYEKVAHRGHKSVDLFQKLGNAYYFNGEYEKAANSYEQLFALSSDVSSEYYFRYAQSLKSIGKYELADKYLEQFYMLTGDNQGNVLKQNRDYIKKLKENTGRYTLEDAGINTEASEYGSFIKDGNLIFSSTRSNGKLFQKKHTWTGQYFSRLYTSKIGEKGLLNSVEEFSKEIDTKLNESTPVFTKDGQTVYFTRNNINKGKKRKSKDKIVKLKIYRASLKDGKWTDIKELPFNSNEYSAAHPALSPDEKFLYFASDMPGTLGESDIFRVALNSDGSFGKPENLGDKINTSKRETFPFVTAKNELYFSSDGHLGLGGLDIFSGKFQDNGTIDKITNLGTPLNSPKDDFSYTVDTKTHVGYITSNRDGGVGSDDIYKFVEKPYLHTIKGNVTDLSDGQIIAGSKVSLYDADMNLIKTVESDALGNYTFSPDMENQLVDRDSKYFVKAENLDYDASEQSFTTPNEAGETTLNFRLNRNSKEIKVGNDLAKVLDLGIIYFDLDKWNIRSDAGMDLEKVIETMKQNPEMRIEIRSHTDSRQTHAYNQKLSERRAKSTLEYLVKRGIKRSRLQAKGFGETRLINSCEDGAECSEEEHQRNRRSEFIILSM